jgi:hypothetical protein
MRCLSLLFAILQLASQAVNAGEVSKTLEVTAKLIDIPGEFPEDDLYDYAYVMKYRVIGGKLDGNEILVAHYKPRRARQNIKDQMQKFVSGKLKRFKQGDRHKLTLDPELEKIWHGAVIDDFFATDRKSTRYWCLKVDPAK